VRCDEVTLGGNRLTVVGLKFAYGTRMGRLDEGWSGLVELVRDERADLVMLQGCSGWRRYPWMVDYAGEDFGLSVLVAPSVVGLHTVLCYRGERLELIEWDDGVSERTSYGCALGVLAERETGRKFSAVSVDLSPWGPEKAEAEARLIGELTDAYALDAIVAGEFRSVLDANPAGCGAWAGLIDVRTRVEGAATEAATGSGNRTYVSAGLVPGIATYRDVTIGRQSVTVSVVDLARTV
jgi:hypothetical protein